MSALRARSGSVRRRAAAAAVVLLLAGCATAPGPRQHLLTAPEVVRTAWGGWVEVRRRDGGSESAQLLAAGELLAASADTLHLLTQAGLSTVVRMPEDRVILVCEHNRAGEVAGVGFLQSLACVFNGWFMWITMPLTWVAGAIDSQTQARVGVVKIDAGTWDVCRECARFPQGMPPGLDPSRLTLMRSSVLTWRTTPLQ